MLAVPLSDIDWQAKWKEISANKDWS